ncbi:hypothetical protein H8959_000935, partial [Pygathrix nigripes]
LNRILAEKKSLKPCRTTDRFLIQLLAGILNSPTYASPTECVLFVEKQHFGLALDMDSEYLTRSDKAPPGLPDTELQRTKKRKKTKAHRAPEIEKYQEGEEDRNPPCPRLNGVLMEAGEPEVLQDSLSGCYSTPSSYFQLPDSFQHYTSAFYSLEEQHVSLVLDVDNGFFTSTDL